MDEKELKAGFAEYMSGIYARWAQQGQITLGALIKLLEGRPADQQVVYDFGGLQPKGLESYRGIYEHLALGHTPEMAYGDMSVARLLDMLRAAVGLTYQGYKGGDYVMTEETPMWVANHGDTGNTAIVGLCKCSYATIIKTAYMED